MGSIMSQQLQLKIQHPYIEKIKGVCGGGAIIKGTRIKVSQIVIEHLDLHKSIEEIVHAHPHLHYWEVYDALSYYYENQTEIDQEIVDELKCVEEFSTLYPSKMKAKLKSNVN